jgi:hypothetical protein
MRGISGIAGKLLALQERLCCMEFVGWLVNGECFRENRKTQTAAEMKLLTAAKFILSFE